MKVLIICDHYPLSPRVKKMRTAILRHYPKYEVKVFAWNREINDVEEDYVNTFNQNIGYGNKAGKLFNLIKFIKKVKEYKKKYKPDYIHAIDLEMLIASKIISKKEKIIYEIYDIKSFKNKFINKLREEIETHIIKKNVNSIILASPYFKDYYNEKGITKTPFIIVNNKPSNTLKLNEDSGYMKKYKENLKNDIVIGFIGTIRHERILLNLIDSVKEIEGVKLLLAGNGPSYNNIKRYIESNNIKNKVIMTGRYETNDMYSIYNSCDYIWAAYPNKNLNVKYAISNKFFESIVFNKKAIVSENTMVGRTVIELDIGFVVNPYSQNDIKELIRRLKKGKFEFKQTSFGEGLFWEDEDYRIMKIYN